MLRQKKQDPRRTYLQLGVGHVYGTDVVTGILSSSRDKEDEYVAEARSQGLDALAENVGMWVRVREHCSLLARRQSTAATIGDNESAA